MMDEFEIPLFPLNTVLFPGGPLPLRVFEPRYLNMVSRCLKEDTGFGVVLIREGAEVGSQVQTFAVGTLAAIVDWDRGEDGLLGVTAHGGERFRLLQSRREADGLYVGRVRRLAPEPRRPLEARFCPLSRILESVLNDLGPLYDRIDKHYEDASWVGFRLAELLPLALAEKQALLELEDADRRLERIVPVVQALQRDG